MRWSSGRRAAPGPMLSPAERRSTARSVLRRVVPTRTQHHRGGDARTWRSRSLALRDTFAVVAAAESLRRVVHEGPTVITVAGPFSPSHFVVLSEGQTVTAVAAILACPPSRNRRHGSVFSESLLVLSEGQTVSASRRLSRARIVPPSRNRPLGIWAAGPFSPGHFVVLSEGQTVAHGSTGAGTRRRHCSRYTTRSSASWYGVSRDGAAVAVLPRTAVAASLACPPSRSRRRGPVFTESLRRVERRPDPDRRRVPESFPRARHRRDRRRVSLHRVTSLGCATFSMSSPHTGPGRAPLREGGPGIAVSSILRLPPSLPALRERAASSPS